MTARLGKYRKQIAAGGLAAALAWTLMLPQPVAQLAPPVYNDKFGLKDIRDRCHAEVQSIKLDPNDSMAKVKALQDCRDREESAWKAWKDRQGRPSDTQTTASAACVLKDARKRLLDVEDEGSTFYELHQTYDRLSKALKNERDFDLLSRFGLPANKRVQQYNRQAALSYLTRAEKDLGSQVRDWAAASSPACFDCAIMERWSVLRGASNLVANSWFVAHDNEQQFRVGPNIRENVKDPTYRGLLTWTGTVSKQDLGTGGLPKGRDLTGLAKPISNFELASDQARWRKAIHLNAVSDQWVNSLPADFILELQRRMCKLDFSDGAERNEAYDTGRFYFEYAKQIQELINSHFDIGTFEKAFEGEAEVAAGFRRRMIDVEGGIEARRCGAQEDSNDNYDLMLWNRMPGKPTRTHAQWCKRFRPSEIDRTKPW